MPCLTSCFLLSLQQILERITIAHIYARYLTSLPALLFLQQREPRAPAGTRELFPASPHQLIVVAIELSSEPPVIQHTQGAIEIRSKDAANPPNFPF